MEKRDSTAATLALIACAAALRLGLYYATDLHNVLADTVWLSTPITSWRRFCDGLWLLRHGLKIYSGDLFHQTPILLYLMEPLPETVVPVLFVLVDVAVGLMLHRIAANKHMVDVLGCTAVFPGEWNVLPSAGAANSERATHLTRNVSAKIKAARGAGGADAPVIIKPPAQVSQTDGGSGAGTLCVAALYWFNPLSVVACLAFDVGAFERLAVTASVYTAVEGNLILSSLCAALATYLGLYPVMLLPAIGLLFSKRYRSNTRKAIIGVILSTLMWTATLHIATAFLLDYNFADVFRFWSSFYGTILTVPDLTPNLGLWWYFMLEVFDHFRPFFVFVFQTHIFIYTVPLAWRFRERPLFIVLMSLGIMATFKSYPAVGDYALWFGFAPLYAETWKYFRYSFLSVSIFVYSCFLCPTMYVLWVFHGSGNANFYYALNLVVTVGSTLLMSDSVYGLLRREYDRAGREQDAVVYEDTIYEY
ncbi:hypothetical protein RI367_004201 [Sorochytrium milnesiophthora]